MDYNDWESALDQGQGIRVDDPEVGTIEYIWKGDNLRSLSVESQIVGTTNMARVSYFDSCERLDMSVVDRDEIPV